LSVSAEYRFEKINSNRTPDFTPSQVVTHSVPIKVNYFDESGLFVKLTANYVNQSIKNVMHDKTDFWVFNALIGYRIPNRYGIIEIGVKNLFDNNFKYEGNNLDSRKFLQPLFQQDRSIYGKIKISY